MALCELAEVRDLDPACAAELCLERALVVADLIAVACAHRFDELLMCAVATPVSSPLPSASASYLQMLIAARDRCDAATTTTDQVAMSVALRLFPRIYSVMDELGDVGEIELGQALALEIAAVASGRTMSEWAAVAALKLSQ